MTATMGSYVGPHFYESDHTAMAHVLGGRLPHDARLDSGGRPFLPRSVKVTWRRNTALPEWRSGWIVLSGPQIRQDGSEGTRELSQTIWVKPDGKPRDVSPESDLWPIPGWALDFYRASHPGGAS